MSKQSWFSTKFARKERGEAWLILIFGAVCGRFKSFYKKYKHNFFCTVLFLLFTSIQYYWTAKYQIHCSFHRLRELHTRNNRLNMLLELAVYMRQLRRLIVLDLRANPICSMPSYKDVVINTFPILLSLDALEINPVEQVHKAVSTFGHCPYFSALNGKELPVAQCQVPAQFLAF